MTAKELAGVVADPRLSNEAVRLILFVASHGAGEHDVEADELRLVLGCKDDRVVRAARERATRLGYVTWRKTGRANTYKYTPVTEYAKNAQSDHAPNAQSAADHAQNAQSEYAKSAQSEPPIVVAVEGEEKKEGDSPSPEPGASKAIEKYAELFEGCRGAMKDYLVGRVPKSRQEPYVQTVATWMNGFGFAWRNREGSTVPAEDRPGLLAAAMNELAATDEKLRKHPSGDPANLKNKLGILVKDYGIRDPPQSKKTAASSHAEYDMSWAEDMI